MKWNHDKSILLTRVCILVSLVGELICAVAAPGLVKGIVLRRGMDIGIGRLRFLLSLYGLMVPATFALIKLSMLIRNITRGQVFVEENITCLRHLSWACFLAMLISLLSAFYYLPFAFLTLAAGFMGLLLRVLKNVFEEAVRMKQENDYTI